MGFTFKDGGQNILWGDIEEMSLTFVVKKEINDTFTGYPFLFLKLKRMVILIMIRLQRWVKWTYHI